jgi:hypothetical protein
MKMTRGWVVIASVSIIACVAASEASADQRNWFGPSGGRSMFWGNMFAPQPMFYPPPRQRYYYRPPPHREVHRDLRPKSKVTRTARTQKSTGRAAALAGATSAIPAVTGGHVTCERAQAIVAEYGFTEIQPQTCEGRTYGFSATRDGKPFSVKIVAADGELAEVKKR